MNSTSDIFVRYKWKENLSMDKSKMRISRGRRKVNTLTYFIMIGQLRTGVIPIITLML